MKLRLLRDTRIEDECTIGGLYVDFEHLCDTLEDPFREIAAPVLEWKIAGATAIPMGEYRIEFTVSERAKAGHLWTPDAEFRLPQLMDVPGFEGVRIHAGNTAADTEGCILVGKWDGEERVANSRETLTALMKRLRADSENSIRVEEKWPG